MPGEEAFATPQAKKICIDGAGYSATPGRSVTTFEIPPSPCLKRLGFGTGVNVMLYERSPKNNIIRSPWAIKKLNKRISVKSEYAKRLEEEAEILKKLQHPNIIGYRGFKRSEDGSAILIIENGQRSLSDIINDLNEGIEHKSWFLDPKNESDEEDESQPEQNPHPLPAENILKVIRAMAGALDYLHTSTLGGKPKLLHGDLKSANVLVKGEFDEIKLCDFGVTLPLDDAGEVCQEGGKNQYIGTEPWSAKEVIEEETISTKTDIYALGCTIYEMLSLETPHFNKMGDLDDDDNDSIDDTEYQNALGTRPDLPDYLDDFLQDDAYEKILGIYYACTSENPSERPSAAVILEILDSEDVWQETSEAWNFLLMEYEKEKAFEHRLDFDELPTEEDYLSDVVSEVNSEICNSNCNHSSDSIIELLPNEEPKNLNSKDSSIIEISDDELLVTDKNVENQDKREENESKSVETENDMPCYDNINEEEALPELSKEDAEDEVNKWLEATLSLSRTGIHIQESQKGCSEEDSGTESLEIKIEKTEDRKFLPHEESNHRHSDEGSIEHQHFSDSSKNIITSANDEDEVNKWLEQTFNSSKNTGTEKSVECKSTKHDTMLEEYDNLRIDIDDTHSIKVEQSDNSDEYSNKQFGEKPWYEENNPNELDDESIAHQNHSDSSKNIKKSQSDEDEVNKWLEQTLNLSVNQPNMMEEYNNIESNIYITNSIEVERSDN